ncbi:S8 family serine peptidase [Bacillus sp. AFS041924]|uniref:S8 family serine peptidase n=1 Tax=Bacillus sp. AFS041924 TaxID=2033503 RepID=UPI00159B84D7|nr:S8 family serine peptidase [Bacillus sp. AFS041924]
MRKNKFSKTLAKTTLATLLMTSVVPFNVLADSKGQGTIQGINPSKAQTRNYSFTPEQLQAMSKIRTESEVEISPQINVNSPEQVRVIVQFKQAPAEVAVIQQQIAGNEISLKDATNKVNNTHKKFKEFVQRMGQKKEGVNATTQFNASSESAVQITHEYKQAFNGVAMTLPGTDVEKLLDSSLVSQIFADHVVKIDPVKSENSKTNNKAGNGQLATTASSEKLSVPEQNTSTKELRENYIPLPGIDDLHKDHITGKGIKVGVIDTGIDYNHPDLTNVYKGYRKKDGEDEKTIDPTAVKGWDFVDNDADPMETNYEDWVNAGKPTDPSGSYYTYHGTHVSGTIAGQGENNVDNPAIGVAPDVDLYSYRVLGPWGSGSSSDIIAGIDKAVQDGMDVINLSLGVAVNDPLMPESIAINNATLAGVACTVSAGNAGPSEKTLGSPGTAAFAITVGASDFPMAIPTASATVGSETFNNMKLLGKGFHDHLDTLENKSYPIVYVGLGGEDDFKDANGQAIDLTGKVALIQRGTFAFTEKVINAKKAGAVAVIVYNNVEGEIDQYLANEVDFIPAFRLTKKDGERLKAASETSSITFSNIGSVVTEGNHLAGFSSRGPATKNYDIKPDVVAPGVSVYSTYPEFVHSPEAGIDYSSAYARISGTSMASPHVAGIAALILQAHPEYTPFDVKSALMNTSDKLSDDYSVYEVGAGLVDVKEAVHTKVSVKVMDKTQNRDENGNVVTIDEETGSIAYGTVYKKENNSNEDTRNIVIKNKGTEQKSFDISYEYSKAKSGVLDAVTNKVDITTSAQSITVEPGQSVDLTAKIRVPGNAKTGRYEGYVNIVNHSNPQESYRVPFAVRAVDKGIDSFEMELPAISNKVFDPAHPFEAGPFRALKFKLNSPMENVRAIIYNKEGRALGSTSPSLINATTAPIDEDLFLNMSGYYYPFVGESNEEKTADLFTRAELPEGQYTLKFRAVDAEGKSYEKSQLFVIDNTLPKLTFKDKAPGKVYELKDSDFTQETLNGNAHNAFWIHANLYDKGTNLLAPLGITQSSNTLWYYQNQNVYPDGDFPVEANGDVKFGIEKEDIENGPATIMLFPMDMATNARLLNDFYPYAFVKEGTPYVVPSYDKDKVYLNDTLTMTLSLNNVEKFMSGTYDLAFYNHFEFLDVKVNKEFQQYAKANGLTVNVDEPVVKTHPVYDWSKKSVNVGAHISGNGFQGYSGDSPFLDVTFKLVDDHYYILSDKMNVEDNMTDFNYTKFGESEPTKMTLFSYIDGYDIIPKHSYVDSYMHLEPFMGQWDKDFTKVGAKVYAQSSTGEKYPGTVDPNGYFNVKDIPVSKDPYDIVVEAPGHLKSIQRVNLDNETTWGEKIGSYLWAGGTQPEAAAGDVNGDGVIDVLDVKQVAKKYGQQNNENFNIEDLNQDGIVNATDMNFVVKNYLKSNPDATITPKEVVDGKYITDFLNVLGISSTVKTLKNTSITNQSAALSWLAAVDATEVKIEQSSDNGATWSTAKTGQPVTVDSNNTVVIGLSANTTYQFRVNVTGGLNEGTSNVVNVKTSTNVTLPKTPSINVIDDNDTKISGTADPNTTIIVKYNGKAIATGLTSSSGTFSIKIKQQKAGTVLSVTATDKSGNVSAASTIKVIDKTAPKAPSINAIDNNDTKISGNSEASAKIVVKNNGKTIATGIANNSGVYSIKIKQQKAGTVLSITATDKSGNVSAASTIKVLDKTAPNTPKITSFIVKNRNQIQITGTAEANSTIVVKIGTKVVTKVKVSSRGTFTVKLSKVGKGKNKIFLYAVDKAGNKSKVVNRTVTIK